MRSVFVSVACVLGIALLIGGYFFNWTWTGFGPYTPPTSDFQREKTLYDWLQLAIIPAAIAFGVVWFTRLQQQRDQQLADMRAKVEREAAEKRAQAEREAAEKRDQTERDIALDNQREVALQAYIDDMSSLLLEKNLRKSGEDDEVRKVARIRTLTVLPRLDKTRKSSVLQFLYESGLIYKGKCIIVLGGADLRGADLSFADLRKADLSGARLIGANLRDADLRDAELVGTILREADLSRAFLIGANLYYASLNEANLIEANLGGANLEDVVLFEAKVTTEQLNQAKSLKGATLFDGTIHT